MKIVNQTNEQECGICVLTSLHNYFYNEPITKDQVLDKSNISQHGMTIFDFESLGKKLGIECESYEITFTEFINLKINGYFVLLLSTPQSNNHYVIAKKKKKYIEIYDSCSLNAHKLSYKDLQKVFLNVLILTKKEPNQLFNKIFSNINTVLLFDIKFVLLNLLLSILILVLSIASASFLNYVIDIAIAKDSINNLITICFIFIFVYFGNNILTYVSHLYMTRHVKNNLILFTSKMLSSLESKKLGFLDKVDKNWIYKIDECAYNIANFSVVEINKFISNIIFCVICICIVASIQYYLLIFVALYAIIEFIFFIFAYRKKKQMFLTIVRSENANVNEYKKLINYLSNEIWSNKRNWLIKGIKENYSNIYKNYSDVILFKTNSSLWRDICKSLCEILAIFLMSYLIIVNNNLSIGQLTFVVSAFALYKASTADLFNYFLSRLEFNVYWQVYRDITTVDNTDLLENNQKYKELKVIEFVKDNIKLFSNKINFNVQQSVFNLLKTNQEIHLNNQKDVTDQSILNSVVIFSQQSCASKSLLTNEIEKQPELYSQYLKYFHINFDKNEISFYENIIINFLHLLSIKNSIIFLDNVWSLVKTNDKLVIKQLLFKVKKTNTVFIVEGGNNG